MSVGLVSDDDFNKELEQVKSPVEIIQQKHRGRSVGDNNVPDGIRKIIGEEANINGRQAAIQLATEFGISASSVSAYTRGATSTASYNSPAKSLIDHINKSRVRYAKKAGKVLGFALNQITEDKLESLGARHLAGIAKDMAATIKSLEPDNKSGGEERASTPQFVVFAPQFRDERSFDTIVLKDET